MTYEEAEDIIDLKLSYDDMSCSCHINPPCSKCEYCPSDEEYDIAIKVLELEL